MPRKRREPELVNLTGHEVTVISWDDRYVSLPKSGFLRIQSDTIEVGRVVIDDISVPLLEIRQQIVEQPDIRDDRLYVVSGIAAAKAIREDFIIPSRVVRSNDGKILGAKSFSRVIPDGLW